MKITLKGVTSNIVGLGGGRCPCGVITLRACLFQKSSILSDKETDKKVRKKGESGGKRVDRKGE